MPNAIEAGLPAVPAWAPPAATRWLPALLGLAALLLSVWAFGGQGLWFDELFTFAATDPARPVADVFAEVVLPDVHPPLYYLVARAWTGLFGTSELAYRSLSLLAAAGALLALHHAERAWFGRGGPAVMAALAASLPFTVYFAKEARAYALLLLLCALLLWTTLLVVRDLRAGKLGRGLLLAHLACMVAACLTHYFGYVAALCHGLVVLAAAPRPREALGLLVAYGVAAILPAAWLLTHLPHLGSHAGGNFWIPFEPLDTLEGAARLFSRRSLLWLAAAGLVAWCAYRAAQRGTFPTLAREAAPWLLALAGMVALPLLLSLHTPVATPRNYVVLVPPALFLAALAARGAGTRAAPVALLLFAALNLGATAWWAARERKPAWDPAAEILETHAACHGAAVPAHRFPGPAEAMYAYHARPLGIRPAFVTGPGGSLLPGPGGLTALEALAPSARASGCPLLYWGAGLDAQAAAALAPVLSAAYPGAEVRRMAGKLLVVARTPGR